MIGTRLGPYELREEIGGGGMATVYRAYQPSMDRDVAIKVINKTFAGDPNAVQRFQREARLIARLEHTHILPVYDFDGGHEPPYIVMRYLNGGTLREVLKHSPLPPDEVLHLMRQAGAALDYAHRQGIVHRDVKPSNVIVDREGNAFVSDFGIAHLLSGNPGGPDLTASGAVIGTPDYMAPEQALGRPGIDQRADIYSMGVMLFEMLCGAPPFSAGSPLGVLVMHVQEPVPSVVARVPGLPPAIDAVIARAMAKDRAQRYATAAEFVEAVAAGLGGTISTPTQLRLAAQESMILRLRSRNAPGTHAAPATQAVPSEQNRVVTVMYANASEYAELVEDLQGSESARQAVNLLWDAGGQAIAAHHGMVFKRDEQELLALWGTDSTREDDAEQAVRAALAIQSALRELSARLARQTADEPLPIKLGLHTGLALLTSSGEGAGHTASGATLSLANRLMQQSGGEVLLTQATYSQVRGVFDVTPAPALRTRTSREEIQVYCVHAAKARAFHLRTRGVEGVETRMVGREAELKVLQDACLSAVEDQETRAVTIAGEAGLGKSRLLYEFDLWSELRPERFWVLRGRATPEMTSRPYALVRDAISLHYEILDDDSPAVARRKLEAGVRQETGSRDEMAHLIGHLSGFDFSDSPYIKGLLNDPQQLARRARQLFTRWVAKLASVRTVIVELEDIHHADNASLNLLAELISEQQQLPLLILSTARPALYERRPAWGGGQHNHTRLTLHAMDRRAARELAREILQKVDELPRALRDLLAERCEGNPFYMEELVKVLIDDRVIHKDSDERWRVETSRLTRLSVPPTLAGLLQTRLDSLLYPERLTLQRAAVIGQVFHDKALLALDAAGEPREHVSDLPGVLARLVEREFIRERETSDFAGSVEYIFASQMLRDMLVSTLLRRQQQSYCASAAAWLIQASGARVDEYLGLIADFYERAGDNEQAGRYLQRAAERSLRLGAYGEARGFFERALALLPAGTPGALAAQIRLGEACDYLGEYPAARQSLEPAVQSAREQGERALLADGLYWLSRISMAEGHYAAALQQLQEGLALAREAGDTHTLVHILSTLGVVHVRWTNDVEQARACCEESVAMSRRAGDAVEELHALDRLAMVAKAQGNLDEARRLCEETLARARETGNRERTATALNNLAVVVMEQGDVDAARSYCLEALPIARETDQKAFVAHLLINLLDGDIRLGSFALAHEHLREALLMGQRTGGVEILLVAVTNGGWMLAREGRLERGLRLIGAALSNPAASSALRAALPALLGDIGADASDARVSTALDAGKALALDEAVAALLAELPG